MPDTQQPGTIIERLEVSDLAVDGSGIARFDGRVVFLDGGLPGAVVAAMISGTAKRALTAKILKIIEPSPHETSPWCPHVPDCGGCAWQHFDYQASLDWKRNHVRQALKRIGKVAEPHVAPVTPSPRLRAHRNKLSFAFAPGPGGRPLLGLRKRKGHEVVEVAHCGLMHEEIMPLLDQVRGLAAELQLTAWEGTENRATTGREAGLAAAGTQNEERPARRGRMSGQGGYLRHLVVHRPDHAIGGRRQLLVECITGPEGAGGGQAEKIRQLGQALMERCGLDGFVHGERANRADLAVSERRVSVLGRDSYTECIGPVTLEVPVGAFLQTNTAAAGLLYEQIIGEAALSGAETVWDCYCGVGGIGLALAGGALSVHGFEISAHSVAAARRNSRALGLEHCFFHQADLEQGRFPENAPAPDVLVLDPPRGGISEKLARELSQRAVPTILYISCDAGTLSRDVLRLADTYTPVACRPYDLFPYTPHIENLLVLKARP